MPDNAAQTSVAANQFSVGEQSTSAVKWFIVAAVLALLAELALLGWQLKLSGTIATAKQEQVNLEGQLASKKYRQVEERMRTVKAATEGVHRAQDRRTPTLEAIKEIESRLTKDAKLISFISDPEGQIKVEGETTSYSSVAKVMVSLSASPAITAVTLSSVGNNSSGQADRIRFGLLITVNTKKLAIKDNQSAIPVNPPVSTQPTVNPSTSSSQSRSLLPPVAQVQSTQAKERR